MNAKRKELQSFARECPASAMAGEADAGLNVEARGSIALYSDAADFVDALIWEISTSRFEAVLPHLLKTLTPREQQVFACVRQDMPSCAIAKSLKLSAPRISQSIDTKRRTEAASGVPSVRINRIKLRAIHALEVLFHEMLLSQTESVR